MPVDNSPKPQRYPKLMVGVTLAAMAGIPALLLGAIMFLAPLLQQASIDRILDQRGVAAGSPWRTFWYVVALALLAFVMVNYAALFSGVISWYERRIAGRMQSRIGPNRLGYLGFFVWIADAVKMILKEDLVPDEADALLFRAAPYF